MIVETEFDGTLEEDVILEEVDDVMNAINILKNAENIYKANLYLKEMFTSAPVFNEVLKFDTIETSGRENYQYNENSSLILIKNLRDTELKVYLNGGCLTLLAFESFEFPVVPNMVLDINGRASIVETKYK
jgi:hypothetical protein